MDKDKIEEDWNFWLNHSKDLQPSPKKKKENNFENYYFIFDSFKNEIDFVSQSMERILGYDRSDFSILNLISQVHPDDYEYVLACEHQSLEFSNSLYYNDNFRFNTTYSFRIKTNNCGYISVKQEYHALEINENGNMSKALVIHIRLPDDFERTINDFKIYDRQLNKIVNVNNIYNLTKRELEIVELVGKGFKSLEIADKLNVSKYTVDTHRKNILAKTKTSSFFELSGILMQ